MRRHNTLCESLHVRVAKYTFRATLYAPTFGRLLPLDPLWSLDGRGTCSEPCRPSFSRRFSRFSLRPFLDFLLAGELPPCSSAACSVPPIIIDPVVSEMLRAAPSKPLRLSEPPPFCDSLICSDAFCRVFSTSCALQNHGALHAVSEPFARVPRHRRKCNSPLCKTGSTCKHLCLTFFDCLATANYRSRGKNRHNTSTPQRRQRWHNDARTEACWAGWARSASVTEAAPLTNTPFPRFGRLLC